MRTWKLKREVVLKRDKYKCTECGSTENLHVHHTKYGDGIISDVPDEWLKTLCRDCHSKAPKAEGKRRESETAEYVMVRLYTETYLKIMKIAKKNGRSFIMQLKIIVDDFNEKK